MNSFEKQTTTDVQKYYSETLQSSEDLLTSTCCPVDAMPTYIRDIAGEVHPDVTARFYGCGSPIPNAVAGKTILDLGCGTGRDAFIFSKLVGEQGQVIGVDMTAEQLAVANEYADYHREKFGYAKSNTTFHHGYIEELAELGIKDNSIDVVTSNCVLNLTADKKKVFSEIFRVLKPGGELYFSDVFASRRIPEELQNDPILRGECLGGALYTEDFRRLMVEIGCNDHRVLSTSSIAINNVDIESKLGMVEFLSVTVRAFKIDVEDRCEDYGQVAWYHGGIEESPEKFILDDHHVFEKDRPMLVCSNTARMLQQSRFGAFFEIQGDESTHYGLFDCNSPSVTTEADATPGACC
jgi:arsenite methyltransferase